MGIVNNSDPKSRPSNGNGLDDEIDKEKVREILHDILTEVYSKSTTDTKSGV